MMDEVRKHDSSKCNTPSSEPFRTSFACFISVNVTVLYGLITDVKKTTEVVKSSHTSALQIQSRHGIGEPEEVC
jgi:hypothetical protein